ncbi:hypothetical protein ACSVHC_15520 [Arthrobacter sp. KNU-44]|uniref:hypothetical protein n=1 Tax=Arthrobacter sp. KNU-44 TaxID=3450744 RepID=UPI003F42A2D5
MAFRLRLPFAKEEPAEPTEQLTLIQEEIARERPLLLQRIASMHTRGSLLVTASGVVSVVQASQPATPWQYISVLLGATSAVIGLFSLVPKRGKDAMASKFINERLVADAYSVRYSIVMDSAKSLDDDADHLRFLGRTITWGYSFLVVALTASMIISTLHEFKKI